MTNDHYEAEASPSAAQVAALTRLFQQSSPGRKPVKEVGDPHASRLERPTVRQANNGSVRVLWPSASSKVDVYVWPDGSVDINPLGVHHRAHVRVEANGFIRTFVEDPSTPSSAAAPDEPGAASAAGADSPESDGDGGGTATD